MAHVLNGRKVAKGRAADLRARVTALPRPPGLATVLIGENPASAVYVASKTRRASRLGFHQRNEHLSADISQSALLELIADLNQDDAIDGILVQLPLPGHVSEHAVIEAIRPDKDVDGFHPINTGRLSQGRTSLRPCTPYGVMVLLDELASHTDFSLSGCRAVVIGRSNIVGRPMAMMLEQAGATVSVAHSRTRDLPGLVATADVVVAAVGRPRMVQGAWLKPGAVVIDVGINRLDDGSLCGDVDFDGAEPVASAITPVPGGVGPMTIAMLMANTVTASERRQASGG